MSVIPCKANAELQVRIRAFAEVLKTQSHLLGDHGLEEQEFYDSGLFRGAIERIRGQFAASMREKRDFASAVLNWLQDQGLIREWYSAGEANRHDYTVELLSGRTTAIELKGCLDGNNTNIFDRPPHANEFVIWSVCTNPGANPRHNVWSGIHTRLSAEVISRSQLVDGLIVWDMVCGTIGRPCPKIAAAPERVTQVAAYELPPPCIYLFPGTIPAPRNNPHPQPHALHEVEFLQVLHEAFGGWPEEINTVEFVVDYQERDTVRATVVRRGGVIVQQSGMTPIRRM